MSDIHHLSIDRAAQLLTPSQRRVFDLLLDGLEDKQIARRLGRKQNTVHNHVKAIYRALDVTSRPELFARVIKGLLAGDGRRPRSGQA